MQRWWHHLAGVVALVVIAAACGDDDSSPDGTGAGADTAGTDVATQGEAEALGSEEIAAELDRLYQAAIDAGETEVVVYGPGENDKIPVYELFMERYPEISVSGEYLVGPDLESKLNAEIASGQHIASLLQSGDTSLAPKVPSDTNDGILAEFTPVTIEDLDPEFSDGERRYAHAASASTFGILYNTNSITADEAPASWEDVLDPTWQGRLAWDDPTRFGSAFGFFNKILWDDRYDESYVEDLDANEVHLEASAPAAGNTVATGEFDVNPAYPYSFYMHDVERGAPVGFVFPVEGGNHLSPHYLGLVQDAPSPDAAKLLMSWLFTPEAQAANADIGYYPTMPGVPGPDGSPPIDELDLLEAIPLDEVNALADENLETVQGIWSN